MKPKDLLQFLKEKDHPFVEDPSIYVHRSEVISYQDPLIENATEGNLDFVQSNFDKMVSSAHKATTKRDDYRDFILRVAMENNNWNIIEWMVSFYDFDSSILYAIAIGTGEIEPDQSSSAGGVASMTKLMNLGVVFGAFNLARALHYKDYNAVNFILENSEDPLHFKCRWLKDALKKCDNVDMKNRVYDFLIGSKDW